MQCLLSSPKWTNDCHVQCSGKFCEEIDVMGGFHVARGTTTTKQAAKRWAAMRLLQQLKHVISPAFYNDPPEGGSPSRPLVTLRTAEESCCTYTSVT